MAIDPNRPVHRVETSVAGRALSLETGILAEQAHGAVMVRYGDTMVFGTVVGEREAKEGMDFFPLTVEYEERMYAAGKIPGGFIKREGRPTEMAILAARLTDRPLRPLFPKGYRAEVMVINTVMSADQENDPDILSIIAASAALSISPIPFNGPVGAARVGLIDGELVVNPTISELAGSDMDVVVAGTADAIMMVEGEADQVSEETLLDAFSIAHQEIRRLCALQDDLVAQVGVEKWSYSAPPKDTDLESAVREVVGDRLREAVRNPDKVVRVEGTNEVRAEVLAGLAERMDESGAPIFDPKKVGDVFESLLKEEVRGGILREGIRPDGRGPEDIRPIWCEVGVLPRTHGSAIFTRGQTQVLTIATLGSTAEEQRLDSIGPLESKRYLHHYNFPPYSVGEIRRRFGPSRRDIGHGALAERALLAVIPSSDDFPYTMRLVSEVVSSNGSTSMGSVCASALALMDAGVPITSPVAGVAMGLVTDGEGGFTVLSDIQGMEDALGDMDFKVAGTAEGVTAIQMDIKVQGITAEIMRIALEQAHRGRQHILDRMVDALSGPRESLSPYAPLVKRIRINPDKIGMLIGPGGKMIRAIQEETSSKIEVTDDGAVSVTGADGEGVERAIAKIMGLTQEFRIEKGDTFTGKVVTIMPFGAFVELAPGKDGLIHISELSEDPAIRVNRVEDVVNIGDEVKVMVLDVAPNGKISLSRRAGITGVLPPERGEGPRGPRRDDRGPEGRGGPPGRPSERGPRQAPTQRGDSDRPAMREDRPRDPERAVGEDRPAPTGAPGGREYDGPTAQPDQGPRSGRPADSRRRPSFPTGDEG